MFHVKHLMGGFFMFKEREILEELKNVNKRLDRLILFEKNKNLKSTQNNNDLFWLLSLTLANLEFKGDKKDV